MLSKTLKLIAVFIAVILIFVTFSFGKI